MSDQNKLKELEDKILELEAKILTLTHLAVRNNLRREGSWGLFLTLSNWSQENIEHFLRTTQGFAFPEAQLKLKEELGKTWGRMESMLESLESVRDEEELVAHWSKAFKDFSS